MVDSYAVPAWIAHIIRQLAEADFVEVALVVTNAEPAPRQPRFSRLRSPRRRHLLFNLYRRFDERLFATEGSAFEPVDVRVTLASVPILSTVPHRPKAFEYRFDLDSVARIRAADRDVMIRFGFDIIRGEILDAARYGIWSYHHGDSRHYRGGPAFFWEMYEGNPVTGTVLQVLCDELDGGRVLYRSFSATDRTSLFRGRNAAYWKTAEFVSRRLRDLHGRGWQYVQSLPEYREQITYDKPIYKTPTNAHMLVVSGRLLGRVVARHLRKRTIRDDWYVGYRLATPERAGVLALPTRRYGSAARFRCLTPPPWRYYADPHVVEDDGRHHVFFEDYDWGTGKGVISWATLNGSPHPRISLALERDYHLSYPFVFRHGGHWYMLPETRESRSVELYRAETFPDRWQLERVLIDDVEAVDPTLLEHADRMWLFVNIATPGASIQDELFLYYADSLTGQWQPHAMNPIVSDVRRARPAGRIIAHDGELIRPSQDCSRRYGWAIGFNRITLLTPSEYEEVPVARVEAGWARGDVGTHTYNSDGAVEVVDGLRPTVRIVKWAATRLAKDRGLR